MNNANKLKETTVSAFIAECNAALSKIAGAKYGGDTNKRSHDLVYDVCDALRPVLETYSMEPASWGIQVTDASYVRVSYEKIFDYHMEMEKDKRYKWNERGVLNRAFVTCTYPTSYMSEETLHTYIVYCQKLQIAKGISDREEYIQKQEKSIAECKAWVEEENKLLQSL